MSFNLQSAVNAEDADQAEVAIRVSNLSKVYQIYDRPADRLKQSVLPRLNRLFGLHSKPYHREFWALNDISFEVKKGETLGIIGRNGAGKSTLLQIICGTLAPSSGDVEVNGRVAALLELGSGFNPEFTGRENVYMNAAILGLTEEEIDSKYDAIVAFADIGEFIEQPVKSYSSGMLVRLAFAVIAYVDADILIVDEALAVGDAFFAQKCMRFLRNFMKTGAVLFVSHDTGAVMNLCNRAIMLNDSHLVKSGAPKDVVEYYLANLHQQDHDIHAKNDDEVVEVTAESQKETVYRDMRADILNQSTLRNDIEVFAFNPDNESFGAGDAKIIDVRLLDQSNRALAWVVGGEDVVLEIQVAALKDLHSPIIGFHFKDRLGQIVFADNTYLVYRDNPQFIEQGSNFSARFSFRMPVLPSGDFSIDAAIATGTQETHVQQHWIHDALLLKVNASSVCHGLIGLPMKNIVIGVNE